MSYTTMDRFGDASHTYAPGKSTGYTPGVWWPDYGPSTTDYNYQAKMHPTNTIFENLFEKFRAGASGGSTPVQVFRPGGHASVRLPAGQEIATPQFRRPVPSCEALFASTIIQPYKSGGRARSIKEGSWYKTAAELDCADGAQPPSTGPRPLFSRSPSAPALDAARGGARISGRAALGAGPELPSWVASRTVVSRPADAAGLKGSSAQRYHSAPGSASKLATRCGETARAAGSSQSAW